MFIYYVSKYISTNVSSSIFLKIINMISFPEFYFFYQTHNQLNESITFLFYIAVTKVFPKKTQFLSERTSERGQQTS